MPAKKNKATPSVKPVARRTRSVKRKRAAHKKGEAGPLRKLFKDRTLWGALPGLGEWAFPLLKELRDE
jgi:hypothetical protein